MDMSAIKTLPHDFTKQYVMYIGDGKEETPSRSNELIGVGVPIAHMMGTPILKRVTGCYYHNTANEISATMNSMWLEAGTTPSIQIILLDAHSLKDRTYCQDLTNNMVNTYGFKTSPFMSAAVAVKGTHPQLFVKDKCIAVFCATDFIPASKLLCFLPSLCKPTAEQVDAIMPMLNSISNNNEPEFVRAWYAWYGQIKDQIDRRKYQQVRDIFSQLKQYNNNTAETRVTNLRQEICDTMAKLDKLAKQLQTALHNSLMEQLKEPTYTAVDELVQYMEEFHSSRIVHLEADAEGSLNMALRSPVIYHAAEELEALINSARHNQYNSSEFVKELYRSLFLSDEYRLWTTGSFKINPQSQTIKALKSSDRFVENDMCNPHLARAGCMGGHSSKAKAAMQTGNLVMLFEILLASTGSLGWSDSIIMNNFTDWLQTNNNAHCVECKDGNFITLPELRRRVDEKITNGSSRSDQTTD